MAFWLVENIPPLALSNILALLVVVNRIAVFIDRKSKKFILLKYSRKL